MSRRTRSLLVSLGLAALLTGGLAGCASATGGGAPDGSDDDPSEAEVESAWLDDGRVIGLVTMGSSTCPPTAEEPTLSRDVLEVRLVEPNADQACTRDYVPRVTFVGVPEGVDPSKDLEIRVTGEGFAADTDLSGVAGLAGPGSETDYEPSAGWTDEDGMFVLLTWGSSTCVPVVESAEATSDTQVTLTFAAPPADQVCTTDMAPRGTVVVVDGFEGDANVEAVLVDAGGEPVTVPIYGEN